jgi:eukaryotic-like serine/threonine-protein kinase
MIGEKLGSYRIDAVLGTGAMGMVYRATNETNGKVAAVKVIGGDVTQRGRTHERFRREAEILQQFRHPNIVRFLALGRYQGTSYFAMEFVPGETLEQMLKRRGALPWREVVELGIQMCEALQYAHEHGVVHRDLKPSNLMITEKGQVKLTDFGIAKDLDATALTATGRTLGTAAYMAPEQIRGTPEVSHKTDLYALGVVLYQMLVGRSPFEGPTAVVLMHSHLNEPPPRPSARLAEIPRALDDLIVKLMAKAPTDRPWDAAAVGVTLADLRDRAERGQTVPLVWPSDGDKAPSGSSGSTIGSADGPKAKKAKKGTKAARPPAILAPARSTIELALLVLGLVAIVGFVGYMFWPPSAAYLYRNAEGLMASKHRSDWIKARDEYLEPLDRRFPDNPYRKTTLAWRDRIPLDEAEGRAKNLESGIPLISDPKTNGERQYVIISKLVREAQGRGDDMGAVGLWEDLTQQLKDDDPEDRKWVLLARKRAAELRKAIAERHEFVVNQLARADMAYRAGKQHEAVIILDDLVKTHGKYTDVAPLLERAGVKVPSPESDKPPAPSQEPSGAQPGRP